MPLLLWACSAASPEFFFVLLQYQETDTNITEDKTGNTALMLAARKGQLARVNALLKKPETNIQQQNQNEKTALEIAEDGSDCKLAIEKAIDFYAMQKLPSEIWWEIARFLDNKSLAALRLVSTYLAVELKSFFVKRLDQPIQIMKGTINLFFLMANQLYESVDFLRMHVNDLITKNQYHLTAPEQLFLYGGEAPKQLIAGKKGTDTFCLSQNGQFFERNLRQTYAEASTKTLAAFFFLRMK